MLGIPKKFLAFSSLEDLGIESEEEFRVKECGEDLRARLVGIGGRLRGYEDNGHTSAIYGFVGKYRGMILFYDLKSGVLISGSDKSQRRADEMVEALRSSVSVSLEESDSFGSRLRSMFLKKRNS